MKLIDANLLLYAYDSGAPLHQRARIWFESVMAEAEPVGFTVATIIAFLRISTNQRVLESPLSVTEARRIVDTWLTHPRAVLTLPTPHHWEILGTLIEQAQAIGNLVPDAHLAACAMEHGATLYTHDRDFSRFPELRVAYPLTQR